MQEQFITITDARKAIFSLSNAVFKKNTVFTLTEHGLPKVILLSPKKYASLQKKQKPTVSATLQKSLTRLLTPHTTAHVQDIASEQYGHSSPLDIPTPRSNVDTLTNAKKLATAQLSIKLLEEHCFPTEQLFLDTCIRAGGRHSNHSIDIDILITDKQGSPTTICITAPFQKYENWKTQSFRDLFELSRALKKEYRCKSVRRLVYFSHTIGQEHNKEYWTVVDARTFSSFAQWKRAGFPADTTFSK